MKFGVCVPNYGESSSAEALRTVALEAESAGSDSLWTTDHILMPRNSGTPYEKIFESITTLSYLTAITSRAKLASHHSLPRCTILSSSPSNSPLLTISAEEDSCWQPVPDGTRKSSPI